jgi:phosphate-selective porin OprO/OprP
MIGQILPLRKIGRGPGAWELATRWSAINLNDRDVHGGQLEDWTFGVNWYLNANSKVQFNYIVASLDDSLDRRSTTGLFGLRGQLDF